jgi:hypothetical protein
VKAKMAFVGTVAVVAVIGVIGLLVNWLTPYVSKFVTKEQFEAIGVHPVSITIAWLALVYVGSLAWRRQLQSRDA